ncbi:MAG: PLP-dependent aminotransferase family protein [Phaeodactylibacter sp.]|nr:PLP-dependent aminotransferase family protein [Phaeodactylibacter sp.]
MDNSDGFLYSQVAGRLEEMIGNGVLRTGDKLPSVRALSEEQGISMSTAFKAYSELEMKGLVEARPKSGYYVRFTPQELPPAPFAERQPLPPKDISVDEMIREVYRNLTSEGIVRLSVAAPALEHLPEAKLNKSMMEALREDANSCIQYDDIQGNPRLRQQLARLSFNWGGSTGPEEIITTQGCMEALSFCLQALTRPGDTVAIEAPGYFGVSMVLHSHGLKALEAPVHPETGIDLDYLEDALKRVPVAACLFVPNFNNPTGACMPDERKERLVRMLARRDIPLIEDDIYGDLYFGKSRPLACKHFDEKGLVLYCSSFSKMLAPGYRVGWCIPGRFHEQVLRQKLAHTVTSATPTHAAMARFLDAGRFGLHMRRLRKALHTQCLRYTQAISDHFPEGVRVTRPQGGYTLWLELPPEINAYTLYRQAIRHNISIAPGQIFSADGRFSNYIRLSYGAPFSEEIERSLRVLGGLIKV